MGIVGSLTDREYQKFREASDGSPMVQVFSMNKLVPEEFDALVLNYSGNDVTSIAYYIGGTNGTNVATLNLGYSDGSVVSIEKT